MGGGSGKGSGLPGNLLLSNLCHNFVASASRANSLFAAAAAASTRRWPQCVGQGVKLVAKTGVWQILFFIFIRAFFLPRLACLMFIMNVTHERI